MASRLLALRSTLRVTTSKWTTAALKNWILLVVQKLHQFLSARFIVT